MRDYHGACHTVKRLRNISQHFSPYHGAGSELPATLQLEILTNSAKQ
jgi:hypothetical protein